MPSPARPFRRSPLERGAAWLATGALGHLYSVVVDLAVYLAQALARRAQRRLSGAGRRRSARR